MALWHKRPKRPNWVGRKTDFAVWLGAFDRIHPQSKFWDKRHGWVSIVLLLPDKPLYRCGSPYFLNYDDSKAVYHFLEKHGINVSNCGTT